MFITICFNFVKEMRKLVTLLLVIMYGLASIGATVHLHYCCGKLDKISLSAAHNKDCPEKEGAFKRCCDSKQVDLKINADQEHATKWLSAQSDLGMALPAFACAYTAALRKATINIFATGPPLRSPKIPLFIQNCIFRI